MKGQKKFNVTGTCVPHLHYMIPPDRKIQQVMDMVEEGDYFTINRPRQYGKTTTLFFLFKELQSRKEFLPFRISFEAVGEKQLSSEEAFLETLFENLEESLELEEELDVDSLFESTSSITSFFRFGRWLAKLIKESNRKVVLLIDEVDQAGNYPIFFQFLRFLRKQYLARQEGRAKTFHSVILAGVHDVKNLKAKVRPDQEQLYNSPWNIAVDFDVDMSFSAEEIQWMLQGYTQEKLFDGNQVTMDIEAIADLLRYYTSGYPFLVSLLCKTVDEKLMTTPEWTPDLIKEAVRRVIRHANTNFESLIKNLENNPDLASMTADLLLDGRTFQFNPNDPVINRGVLYGIFRNDDGVVAVHNRIYAEQIYEYFVSKIQTRLPVRYLHHSDPFVNDNGILDFRAILLKFQNFMREQYSKQDEAFVEREGRLIFLAFLQPILNGKGFTFKEAQISEEKRLDVVITFQSQKFVVELKIWRGEKAHQKGIKQLTDYLDTENLNQGYLLIFDFNKKERELKQDTLTINEKDLFLLWV